MGAAWAGSASPSSTSAAGFPNHARAAATSIRSSSTSRSSASASASAGMARSSFMIASRRIAHRSITREFAPDRTISSRAGNGSSFMRMRVRRRPRAAILRSSSFPTRHDRLEERLRRGVRDLGKSMECHQRLHAVPMGGHEFVDRACRGEVPECDHGANAQVAIGCLLAGLHEHGHPAIVSELTETVRELTRPLCARRPHRSRDARSGGRHTVLAKPPGGTHALFPRRARQRSHLFVEFLPRGHRGVIARVESPRNPFRHNPPDLIRAQVSEPHGVPRFHRRECSHEGENHCGPSRHACDCATNRLLHPIRENAMQRRKIPCA